MSSESTGLGVHPKVMQRFPEVFALFAKRLPLKGLLALRDALEENSPLLCHGATVLPLPCAEALEGPVEAADPIAYALWQAFGLATVREVIAAHHQMCCDVGEEDGDHSVCRYIFIPWDDLEPGRARRFFLSAVRLELRRRHALEPALVAANGHRPDPAGGHELAAGDAGGDRPAPDAGREALRRD